MWEKNPASKKYKNFDKKFAFSKEYKISSIIILKYMYVLYPEKNLLWNISLLKLYQGNCPENILPWKKNFISRLFAY